MYPEITDVSISPRNLTVGSKFVITVKAELVDKIKKVITYFHNNKPSSIGKTELKFNKTTTKTTLSSDGESYRFVCTNIKYTTSNRTQGNLYFVKD